MSALLIIEDDSTVNQLLSQNLVAAGYQVASCFDGTEGLRTALSSSFDLILLDLMIPGIDGLEVLNRLRRQRQTPVLILSARGGEQDRICGFKTGADDYLVKPFSITELTLRIEAILRRTATSSALSLSADSKPASAALSQQADIELNHLAATVSVKGEALALTPLEFDLLRVLFEGAGHVLSKAYLYQAVLCREYSRYDRTLDMHVSKIRKKLNAAGVAVNTVKTVRGQGYMFESQYKLSQDV